MSALIAEYGFNIISMEVVRKDIETLPQEARENIFRVVLDNIRDGVISIDRNSRVTTINKVARDALNCADGTIIGKSIKDLAFRDYALL